ncbi:hypothetical protein ACFLEY_03930 [Bradyrhizobium sp. YCK136]|uniref:LysM domain-containing protein n=1 Tax=Bradyrhizobium diazoefficiens TaxID=1355477 RepID=A0A0E4FUH6_9BRAD|nr:hypothetical protein [Bradyrhizobium diazoefficiens]MBR0861694.1 hypothetical protein [Bradyrhizobium diazoefficiens]MBR0886179.1 hypothetical protein [Bradyrhizobium diazoefficiens]MBR0918002.1 hypothetical protein [Bradyrhizobium diazoefficiens]BAR57862.1 hypothetical protein NK6_4696 [Bradyrhizobium diazoefficiens]
MAERLKTFLQDVRTLRAQQGAEQSARLDRLRAMTPEQLVRLPREELQQLTDRQYVEIVRHVAPEHRLPEPQEVPVGSGESWARLRSIAIPTAARAAVLGVLTGLAVLLASLAVGPTIDWWHYRKPPVRSAQASTWPGCPRLSGWVDGCTYVPVRDIAWERAADLLEMSEAELRQANQHINAAYIPAQATLVLWRHRGQLY